MVTLSLGSEEEPRPTYVEAATSAWAERKSAVEHRGQQRGLTDIRADGYSQVEIRPTNRPSLDKERIDILSDISPTMFETSQVQLLHGKTLTSKERLRTVRGFRCGRFPDFARHLARK